MTVEPVTPSAATIVTIWTALLLYTAGEYGRAGLPPRGWARPAWLLGAACYVAHVAAAFGAHHGWSHSVAYAYTAARTDALFGLAWGGGLWVNYAFTLLWIGEGAWWWLAPTSYARRAPAWTTAVRGAFMFMIVNGAVAFVSGSRRLLGIAVVVALTLIWRRARV